MTSYFITGDRSLDPITAFAVTYSSLATLKLTREDTVFTGMFDTGVERAVRYLFPSAEVILHDVTADGHVDLDLRNKVILETVDQVVFVHSDPFNSRIGRSLVDSIPAARLTFA